MDISGIFPPNTYHPIHNIPKLTLIRRTNIINLRTQVEVFDIIRTLMEIGFNHQHIIRLHLLGQPHCVVTGLIVLVKIAEGLARIMAEWQGGCKSKNIEI